MVPPPSKAGGDSDGAASTKKRKTHNKIPADDKTRQQQTKQVIRWCRTGIAVQCSLLFDWYGCDRGSYQVPVANFMLTEDTDWSSPTGDNKVIVTGDRCADQGRAV